MNEVANVQRRVRPGEAVARRECSEVNKPYSLLLRECPDHRVERLNAGAASCAKRRQCRHDEPVRWQTATDPLIDHDLQVVPHARRAGSIDDVVGADRDVREIRCARRESVDTLNRTAGIEIVDRLAAAPRIPNAKHLALVARDSGDDFHGVRSKDDRAPGSRGSTGDSVIHYRDRLAALCTPPAFDLPGKLEIAVGRTRRKADVRICTRYVGSDTL